jgi:hypothetical protein
MSENVQTVGLLRELFDVGQLYTDIFRLTHSRSLQRPYDHRGTKTVVVAKICTVM